MCNRSNQTAIILALTILTGCDRLLSDTRTFTQFGGMGMTATTLPRMETIAHRQVTLHYTAPTQERPAAHRHRPGGGMELAPQFREIHLLTEREMDRVTAGSGGAINQAEAKALGLMSQATVLTSALVSANGRPVPGAAFANIANTDYVSSQVNAAASKGSVAEASGLSRVFANGVNGGARLDATATAMAAGDGASRAQIGIQLTGITTDRADLVFGSVTASACCGQSAETQIKIAGGTGGVYSRELQEAPPSSIPGQHEKRVDVMIASSTLPIVDPGQMLGLLIGHGSPKY